MSSLRAPTYKISDCTMYVIIASSLDSSKNYFIIITSVGLNSTLQPMEELGGGGLKRMVCQLVDWIFYNAEKNQIVQYSL